MRGLKSFLRPVKSNVGISKIDPIKRGELPRAIVFGRMHVLSRAMTHYEPVAKPAGGRTLRSERAVRLAALTRSPFDDAELFTCWGHDHVATWTWSTAVTARMGLPPRAWIVPEEALQKIEAPIALTRCSEGWALQARDDTGVVVSSRWWPQRPDDGALTRASRGMGLETSREPVEIDAPSLALWPSLNWRLTAIRALQKPPPSLVAMAAIVALTPLLYLGGAVTANVTAAARIAGEVAEIEQEGLEFMEARADLARIGREAEDIGAFFFQDHPVPAIADFLAVARRHDVILERMRVERSLLVAELRSEQDIDPAMLVGDLEALTTLEEVRIERGRVATVWQVRAQISGA